ncbi:hypothetical protein [Streptomyces sp. CRN 30]|uniref:hypothetical protein n=1 Tax=Streptomyces sp. CRN 30 TaxID=3075613 RepID=UPI002A8017A5|nr:hypothetical protein [Streptomyces sp. CRN 30]
MPDLAAARQAKSRIMDTVLNTGDAQRVTGVGLRQQEGSWVVRINLCEDDDGTRRRIPSEIEGVPVVVEVTGTVRAQPAAGGTLRAQRAVPPGVHRHLRLLFAVAAFLAVITTTITLIVVG